jgi:tetratricopeptide (TPR) repeat protein
MKKILLFCLLLLSANAAFAQMEPLERANKAFEYKDYFSAMESYEEVLLTDSLNTNALRNLAHCYEATYLIHEAENALSQLMNEPHTPDDALAYGHVLMQLGKYDKAKTQFEAYSAVQPELGKYFAKAAQNAKALALTESLFTVKNSGLNSEAADFCAAFYSPQQIVFTSTRDPQTQKSKQGTPARLFVATQNAKDDFTNVKLEKRALNDKESEGPASYNETASLGVFVRNNIKNGIEPLPTTGMKQDLFFGAVKALGTWLEIKPFSGNKTDFSSAYPCLSENGKTLYFASDMAGGQGGFDIYKSDNIGGIWTAPINLGDKINTAGDEITPFVEDNMLYFSSNWLMGLGGFDVFELNMQDEDAVPTHLGTGVNTSADDFGYIFNSRLNFGFVTSNRLEGKGQEDIYMISKKQAKIVDIAPKAVEIPEHTAEIAEKAVVTEYKTPTQAANRKNIGNEIQEKIQQAQATATAETVAVNEKNNTPTNIIQPVIESPSEIAQANGTVNDEVNEAVNQATNDATNEVTQIVEKPVTIRVPKAVALAETPAPVKQTTANTPKFVLPQGASEGFVADANTKKAVKDVSIICTNKTDRTDPPQSVLTDAEGRYVLNLKANTLYWLEYNANNYKSDYQQFSTAEKPLTELAFMQLKPKNSGLTPLALGLPATPKPAENAAKPTESAPKTDQTVYEIHVLATEQPLATSAEEELRKHGTLYKVQKDDFFLYKLGWYDNASCAATTCEKVKALGYNSAMATPKKVNPNTGEAKLRLKIGGQKASCPADKPGTGGKAPAQPFADTEKKVETPVEKVVEKVVETPVKVVATEYKTPTKTATPTASTNNIPEAVVPTKNIAIEDIEEGTILDADPEALKRAEDDGFLYYVQLGSFDPNKKAKFPKIEKLKMGKILSTKAKDGRSMYMLGVFKSRDSAYKARIAVSDTGEIKDPFVLKYDKAGNKVQ